MVPPVTVMAPGAGRIDFTANVLAAVDPQPLDATTTREPLIHAPLVETFIELVLRPEVMLMPEGSDHEYEVAFGVAGIEYRAVEAAHTTPGPLIEVNASGFDLMVRSLGVLLPQVLLEIIEIVPDAHELFVVTLTVPECNPETMLIPVGNDQV